MLSDESTVWVLQSVVYQNLVILKNTEKSSCRHSPVQFSTLVLQISGDVSLQHFSPWHCVSAKGRKYISYVEITRKIDFLFAYEENDVFCKKHPIVHGRMKLFRTVVSF